jgi:hypothetical protein
MGADVKAVNNESMLVAVQENSPPDGFLAPCAGRRSVAGMSGKYSRDFGVPKDFPSVLKAFTREVLRSNPADIYEFGANYFSEVLQQVTSGRSQSRAGPAVLPPARSRWPARHLFEWHRGARGVRRLLPGRVHTSRRCKMNSALPLPARTGGRR